MNNLLHQFTQMRRFQKLPPEKRRVVFYSEGPASWAHLGPVAQAFLEKKQTVCWLSSHKNDPGLQVQNEYWLPFYIGAGAVRIFTFTALQCGALVTSTPDLGQNQVKRSRYNPLYIYIHHSLVSHHMIYRSRAFAAFDAIFCSGPHHVRELEEEEVQYHIPARKKVAHGYARLDHLAAKATQSAAGANPRVLVAPSWGAQGLIEGGYAKLLLEALFAQGFSVILRPHPRTVEQAGDKVAALTSAFPQLVLDKDIVSDASLLSSDVMISDWSGVALEYAFSRKRPVLFIDTPRKINNPHYQDIPSVPVEVSLREEIGVLLSPDEIHKAAGIINDLVRDQAQWAARIEKVRDQTVFNLGKSAAVARDEILLLLSGRGA